MQKNKKQRRYFDDEQGKSFFREESIFYSGTDFRTISSNLNGANDAASNTYLETNTAEIQRFSEDIQGIFVANPEIADIQLNTPKVAYVYAKKQGQQRYLQQMLREKLS